MKDIKLMEAEYAKLIVKKGVNIQPGQNLLIKTSYATYPFASSIAKEAYKNGAKFVKIEIDDLNLLATRIELQNDKELTYIPLSQKSIDKEMVKDKWAYVRIDNTDERTVLENVNSTKLALYKKEVNLFQMDLRKALMSSVLTWCVVCAPSTSWAKQILGEDANSDDLWHFLAPILHLDQEDPVKALELHNKAIEKRAKSLNKLQLRSLRCKSSLTDVTIGLSEYHKFEGGGENSTSGVPFYPNIPTEEVFTTPDRRLVNGVITTTKPVSLMDSLVEKARVVFKDGKVIEASAVVGNDVLMQYLDIDQGARYMGEIALVDQRSPISMADTIFHSILYDENASCHFALGAGYPTCLSLPSKKIEEADLIEVGCNQSIVHTDFMFGSDDMKIVGIDNNGNEHLIIENGRFTKLFE